VVLVRLPTIMLVLAIVITALRDVLGAFLRLMGPPPSIALVPEVRMVLDEAEGRFFVEILIAAGIVDRRVLVTVQDILKAALRGVQEGDQTFDLVGGFLPQPDERMRNDRLPPCVLLRCANNV
jgi:hypothetical protein